MLGPRSPSCWCREDTGQESVDDEYWLLLGASGVVLSRRVYATMKKNATLCCVQVLKTTRVSWHLPTTSGDSLWRQEDFCQT